MSARPYARPPAWLLGLANAPLGLSGGLSLLTIPQILSARHVPEPVIADLTTLSLVPTFAVFLLGPLLDVRFSRKTYAIAATLLCASMTAVSFLQSQNFVLLGAAMFLGTLGSAINTVAIGGWFGSLVSPKEQPTFGAWLTVSNSVSFGLIAIVGIQVERALSPPVAACVLALPILLPLGIYAATKAPPPDTRLARESFGSFTRDVLRLLRQATILRLVFAFGVPAASFALTNTLGGLGRDYHASEAFVAIIGGAGATAAGVFGSLIIPPLSRVAPSLTLYVSIGILGALFTLLLLVLPHSPILFAVAMIGQNIAQAASLSTQNVAAVESLGPANPLAATQFGLINAAGALPITYMQLLDGHAYGAGGLTGLFLMDGGLGLAASLGVLLVLRGWILKRPQVGDVLPA